jgi:thymidylate synthase
MSEQAYKELLMHVLDSGATKPDRTGTGTKSIFGWSIYYDVSKYFPLFTAKKVEFANIASELLWFISGSTDVYDLAKIKNPEKPLAKTIWHDNAFAPYWEDKAEFVGDAGMIYGENWRAWMRFDGDSMDQIKQLEHDLRTNPYSRRHMLQSYRPDQVGHSSLPACHTHAQFNVNVDGTLDCAFYMRSNDLLLGHPYNVASYALLTYMLAHTCGLKPGNVIYMGGDCHVYLNHIETVEKYIASPINKIRPTLEIIGEYNSVTEFTMDSFRIHDYHPGPTLSAPMAV